MKKVGGLPSLFDLIDSMVRILSDVNFCFLNDRMNLMKKNLAICRNFCQLLKKSRDLCWVFQLFCFFHLTL